MKKQNENQRTKKSSKKVRCSQRASSENSTQGFKLHLKGFPVLLYDWTNTASILWCQTASILWWYDWPKLIAWGIWTIYLFRGSSPRCYWLEGWREHRVVVVAGCCWGLLTATTKITTTISPFFALGSGGIFAAYSLFRRRSSWLESYWQGMRATLRRFRIVSLIDLRPHKLPWIPFGTYFCEVAIETWWSWPVVQMGVLISEKVLVDWTAGFTMRRSISRLPYPSATPSPAP